jgi:hypothetical protein
MNRYVIYTNDNGTDSYLLGDVDEAEDEYRRLLKDNEDNYNLTQALYIEIEDNKIIEVWNLWLPELDGLR